MKKTLLNILLYGILFYLGGVLIFQINSWKKKWDLAKVEKKYSGNIVLIRHDFAYKVDFEDPAEETVYFVHNANGGFDQWKKGMKPDMISGCGLLINVDGECVTTTNIASPIQHEWELNNLKKEVGLFRRSFNINSAASISVFTIELGYYTNGNILNNRAGFIKCNYDGSYDSERLGVLTPLIETKANSDIATFDYESLNRYYLKKDEKVFMLGYPLQIDSTEKLQTISSQMTVDSLYSGTKTLEYLISTVYNFEGSPVFNKEGNVVAFNTIDEQGKIKGLWTNFHRREKR